MLSFLLYTGAVPALAVLGLTAIALAIVARKRKTVDMSLFGIKIRFDDPPDDNKPKKGKKP
jgi:hypothetical protein